MHEQQCGVTSDRMTVMLVMCYNDDFSKNQHFPTLQLKGDHTPKGVTTIPGLHAGEEASEVPWPLPLIAKPGRVYIYIIFSSSTTELPLKFCLYGKPGC